MAAPLIAAGVLMAAKLGSDYMAGQASKKAAQAAADAQANAIREARKLVEEVGIPDVEALKIVLQKPEYQDVELTPDLLAQTSLKEVQGDALASETKKKALLNMIQRAEQGLDPREKEMARQIQDQLAARTQATNAQNLAESAQRGIATSGIANLQKLLAQQSDANRGAQDSRALLANAYEQRIRAQEAAGNMANSIDETAYRRGSDIANRTDEISKINQQYLNQSKNYNINRRDTQARELADLANNEQTYNKQLLVDNYNRQMGKAKDLGGFAQQSGQNAANLATQIGAGKAAMWNSVGNAAGGMAQAFGGNYMGAAGSLGGGQQAMMPEPTAQNTYDWSLADADKRNRLA